MTSAELQEAKKRLLQTSPTGRDLSTAKAELLKQKPSGGVSVTEIKPEEIPSVGGFAKNVVRSSGQLIGTLARAVIHPIETTKSIGSVLRGASASLIPGAGERMTQKSASNPFPVSREQLEIDKQTASGVAEFYKERYGSLEAIKKTVYEDPVGVVADLSTVAGGAGGALRSAGAVSKIASVERAGATVARAARAIDPITVASKAAGAALNGVGRVAQESLGVSTGAGFGSVREALRNPSQQFTKAMRGDISPEAIVEEARNSMDLVRQNRRNDYVSRLEEISKNKTSIDISGLAKKADALLPNYGIKFKDGVLDFSRSKIADTSEQRRIAEIYQEIKTWGLQKGDRTPVGLDTLKQRLDDFYSPSSQARAFVAVLRKQVSDTLKREVPGYSQMTRGYQEATEFIKETERALSLGAKANTDTAFKKLTSAMRENGELRRQLIQDLQSVGDPNLLGQIAGSQFNAVLPRGLIAKALTIGGSLVNPSMLVSLAFASPRVVGEFLRVVGMTSKQIKEFLKVLPDLRNVIRVYYQANKVTQSERTE